MAKRQVILFLLIVCLPLATLATLAWLGWRFARDEQRIVQQQFRDLLSEKLEDVDRTVAGYFQRRERELLELTELTGYDPEQLRQIVRREPRVGQLFVLNPDGTLLHPDPSAALSFSEREFLLYAKEMFADKALIRSEGVEGDEASPPGAHGWYVRYWGPGVNLIFYRRRPSGKVVGVLLQRSRWIADLIAELPETLPAARDSDARASESRIRLLDSHGETVYQWGEYEPHEEAAAFVETPLSCPLASWRLEHFVTDDAFAVLGRSAYFNLVSALAAVAVGLVIVAVYFYRQYAREVRDAMQRVNFVNQVSHELRTPLTNIRLYADLLEYDLESLDAEETAGPRARLEVIIAESQRLSRLIGNVLTFARQRRNKLSLHPAAGRVDEAIRSVLERFEPSLRQKGIEVTFEGSADSRVRFDADALEQILGNLISNVEKYAAAGGSMEVSSRQEDNRTTIVVADRGPGIPAQLRGKIFRPFYRAFDRIDASTGTGIGLSIARRLAALHGGDVVLLDSAAGARFRIELHTPAAEEEDRP